MRYRAHVVQIAAALVAAGTDMTADEIACHAKSLVDTIYETAES